MRVESDYDTGYCIREVWGDAIADGGWQDLEYNDGAGWMGADLYLDPYHVHQCIRALEDARAKYHADNEPAKSSEYMRGYLDGVKAGVDTCAKAQEQLREGRAMLDVGVHPGLDMDVYLADEAHSKSVLINAHNESWRAARYKQLHETAETDAMRMGSGIHIGILQPDLLYSALAALPSEFKDLRTKAAKAWWSAKQAEGIIPVKPAEMEYIKASRDEVWSNPTIRPFLEKIEDTEITAVWDAVGLRWKLRVDAKTPDYQLEVKSTHSLSRWPNICLDMGYHIAAPHYEDGWFQTTGEILPVRWIVLKNKGAPDSMTQVPSSYLMDMGRTLYQELREQYVRCLESDNWPRFAPLSDETEPPQYAVNQYEEEFGQPSVGQPKFT